VEAEVDRRQLIGRREICTHPLEITISLKLMEAPVIIPIPTIALLG